MKLFPDKQVKSIYDIDIEEMKRLGIKNFIMDIDNTLVETAVLEPDDKLIKWANSVKSQGINICLLSNNNKTRVNRFNKRLQVLCLHRAVKPMSRGFKRAIALLNGTRENTAVIGDQIFTDVYGGNRMGLYTILVIPISPKESILAKVKRPLEKLILKRYDANKISGGRKIGKYNRKN